VTAKVEEGRLSGVFSYVEMVTPTVEVLILELYLNNDKIGFLVFHIVILYNYAYG
jgi:hypothetical protein